MAQSPCQLLGYTEGMEFVVCHDRNDIASAGDHVWLHDDDSSREPEFRNKENEDDENVAVEYISLRDVVPYISGKSPVQSGGYKEGDKFILNEDDDHHWEEGTEVTLIYDDGSTCPKFEKTDKDGTKDTTWLYLGELRQLEPKVGRKVRVLANTSGGHEAGTEGIITEIDSHDELQLMIKTHDTFFWHAIGSCLVYDYAAQEQPESNEKEKATYPTKLPHEWKEGDKGIVRGQQKHDEHHFKMGEEIIFVRPRDSERGIFMGTQYKSTQNIEYSLIEVVGDVVSYKVTLLSVTQGNAVACIKAIRTASGLGLAESKGIYDAVSLGARVPMSVVISSETLNQLFKEAGIDYTPGEEIQPEELTATSDATSSEKTYKYFIDGDSIEVALVGYFDGEPICAYKDRWGDIQTFVAKASLLVSDDD